MKPQEINEKALTFLAQQDWKKAQYLFFENANKFPSHKTYNNLGFYLISEGFLCKDGTQKSAIKLGQKYLEKAAELDESSVNYVALVEAISYELRTSSKKRARLLYEKAYMLLRKAEQIDGTSDLIKYNLYRFSYLLDEDLQQLLVLVRSLISSFACQESVLFYLELLRKNGLKEEGNSCITQYREFLDESDLILFYTTTRQYENGYKFCKTLLRNFYLDDILTACLVESCVRTNHLEEAMLCWNQFLNQDEVLGTRGSTRHIVLDISDFAYREHLISNHKAKIPFKHSCCYFGCSEHRVNW